MPFTVTCPNPLCGHPSEVEADQIGRTIYCTKCGQGIVVSQLGNDPLDPTLGTRNAPIPKAPGAPDIPQFVGRFQIRGVLGQGAAGKVFRGFDPQLEREVAIKVPHLDRVQSAKARARFLQEGKASAKLRHQNIVAILEAGEDDTTVYLVTELIQGKSLDRVIEDRQLSFRQAAIIVRDLAEALAYAHKKGVVHRDVKSANVMVDQDGKALLTDFGLAHMGLASAKLTQTGATLGTPAYMAPEQATGQTDKPLPASDQYSLGVILYELLSGELPFRGPSASVLYQVVHQPPPPLSTLNPKIPQQLDAICQKAMAKKVGDRFPTCANMAQALTRCLEHKAAPVPVAEAAGPVPKVAERASPKPKQKPKPQPKKKKPRRTRARESSRETLRNETRTAEESGTFPTQSSGWELSYSQVGCLFFLPIVALVLYVVVRPYLTDDPFQWKNVKVTLKEFTLLETRTSVVRSVGFSPDGAFLASAGHDEMIRLWDAGTGIKHGTLSGHTSYVLGVAFSPDSRMLASGSLDHSVKLWDVKSRAHIATLSGHSAPVAAVAFSPNGRWVASGGWDNVIKIWNLKTRKEIAELTGHRDYVRALAFSHDGLSLVSGSKDRTVKVWSVQNWKEAVSFSGHTDGVACVAFSPVLHTVASGSYDGTIRLWNTRTKKEIEVLKLPEGRVYSIAFGLKGRALAVGGTGGSVQIWDIKEKKVLAKVSKHSASVYSLAFSPDEKRLVSGSIDKTVRLWEMTSSHD